MVTKVGQCRDELLLLPPQALVLFRDLPGQVAHLLAEVQRAWAVASDFAVAEGDLRTLDGQGYASGQRPFAAELAARDELEKRPQPDVIRNHRERGRAVYEIHRHCIIRRDVAAGPL